MKPFIKLLSLCLGAVLLLSACAVREDGADTEPVSEGAFQSESTPESQSEKETIRMPNIPPVTSSNPDVSGMYAVKGTYMPEAVSEQLRAIFEAQMAEFKTFNYGSAPYVIRDVYTVTDCRLLSISVPVAQTGNSSSGDFILTLTVGNSAWADMPKSPRKTYQIRVDGAEYELSANNTAVYRWIKIDLREYDIVLSETETLGIGKSGDTLIPAFIGNHDNTNAAQKLIKTKFPQITGFLSGMGKGGSLGISQDTLIFDFEWEKLYDSETEYLAEQTANAEYAAKLAAVKAHYAGKKLSILGDSISTFDGVSNNTDYNSTIGGNEVYYPNVNKNVYDSTYTYWGRLLTDLEMELCVNNSWSGSHVYVDPNHNKLKVGDNGRPAQLHRDGSQRVNPDLILFYMGTNDLIHLAPFGDLYEILQNHSDPAARKAAMDTWVSGLTAGSYTTFEQAYALAIKTMRQSYPNAEIVCLTLNPNSHGNYNAATLEKYNACISALAEYFGCGLVEQAEGAINAQTFKHYMGDADGLHPTPLGHAMIERQLVEYLYEKIQ